MNRKIKKTLHSTIIVAIFTLLSFIGTFFISQKASAQQVMPYLGSYASGNAGWNNTAGFRFTPNQNGTVTALWCYGTSGSQNVYLYTDSGSYLAAVTVGCNNVWTNQAVSVPVTTGTVYKVFTYLTTWYSVLTPGATYGSIQFLNGVHLTPGFSGFGIPSDSWNNTLGIVDISFTPSANPTATTTGYNSVSSNSINVTGTVNPGAASTVYYGVSYGTTNTSCSALPKGPSYWGPLAPNSGINSVNPQISGLSSNTTYYYCVWAYNTLNGTYYYSPTTASVATLGGVPTVTLTANPMNLPAGGGTTTLTWTTTNNPLSCTAYSSWSGFKGTAPTNSENINVTGTSTFSIYCGNASGSSAASNVTVTVATVSPPVISVFQASPSSLPAGGGPVTLTWAAANSPTSCTAGGGWSGSKAVPSGSETVNITSTTTFTIYCSNSGGNSSTQSATVTVAPSPGSTGVVATALSGLTPDGSNSTWSQTMGFSLVPSSDGQITALGGYFTGTKKITLWNDAGTQLAQMNVTCSTTWCTQNLPAPVSVQSGQRYWVGMYMASAPGGAYFMVSSPRTAGGMTIDGSYYRNLDTNLSQVSPFRVYQQNYWYGVPDVIFVPGSAATVAPVIQDFSPNPSNALPIGGGSVTLSWTVLNNPASCTGTNGWSGSKAVPNGSETINVTTTTTFTLTCSNSIGSASRTITVNVTTAAPTQYTGKVIAGKRLYFSTGPLNMTSGLILKIIPLYNSSVIAVDGGATNLKSQGKVIQSTGTSGDTTRKIIYFESFPQIPTEVFPYGILSQ